MTGKEALEIFLKLVDPQDESEWRNCQKAHIKLKQDLERLEEIRNDFKVLDWGEDFQNRYELVYHDRYKRFINKIEYDKWVRWLEDEK